MTRCQISVSERQDLIVMGLFSWKIKGSSFCTIMYRQDMCFHCMAPSLEYIFCSWITRKTWHEDDPHSKKRADLIQMHGIFFQIQKTFSVIAVFPLTYLQNTLIGAFRNWVGIFRCYHHRFIKEKKNILVPFHLCLGFCSSRAFELPQSAREGKIELDKERIFCLCL